MRIEHWILAVGIFILIFVLAVGIGWWLRNHGVGASTELPFSVDMWAQPTAGPDPNKNTCQLYTFPTSKTYNSAGVEVVIPGTPTFNSSVLNTLNGVAGPPYPSCIDSDQIWAMQFEHTCAPTGTFDITDPELSLCYLLDGGKTGLGGTETFYSNTSPNIQCPMSSVCPGQISVVSVNYQVPGVTGIYCINRETGSSVTMQPCDPSQVTQIFRVTRTDVDLNPSLLVPGKGQNGLLTQFLDRNSGLCLTSGNNLIDTYYDPSYLYPLGCSGSITAVTGIDVVMGACTGGEYPGYVWGLFGSMRYCPLGSTACTFTPPQISYIGNVDITQMPSGTATYAGLTGSSATVQWLVDMQVKSLYWGGGIGSPPSKLILRDFSTTRLDCINKPYISQYINIPLYNLITAESVCFADLYNPQCIGFY